jgi:protein phosphatase
VIPTLAGLRAAGFAGLRVIGDVHGDAAAFGAAIAGAQPLGLHVLQLGDLTDHGPDSPGALRAACALVEEQRGSVLLGNHDHKLRRALAGRAVRAEPEGLGATLAALDGATDAEALAARVMALLDAAPAWLHLGPWLFVHAAFHRAMLHEAPPAGAALRRADGPLARALYGQVTGRTQADGFPERRLDWLDDIPPGLTVYCGHDQRSRDGRPAVMEGRFGGRAVFLDTGAGKGGHLSWIDLPFTELR